ncbi:MAG TPA: alpha/beta hydrolase [Gemmatimonadaceae bacterium]|jgi:esterase/lipase
MWLEIIAGVVIVLILILALVPTRIAGFTSEPAPARSFDEAVNRIRQRQAVDDRVAAPGGRSIFLSHDARTARVVVLFHGFTNSPKQYEHLGQQLFAAGDNVYIPRLPHHAERNGNARTLSKLTAEELRGAADSAVDIAQGLGDSVIVAGVSAGGSLSAWAAQYRSDVRRAVIVSPVFAIGRVPSFLDASLMNLALRVPDLARSETPDSLRPDRELGVSTRAIAQILVLGTAIRFAAKTMAPRTNDIVFVVNGNDHTVKTPPTVALARQWTKDGGHVVVYEFPRSLGLPHDIAEEAHPNADPAVVYPALEAVIHGEQPPPVLANNRLWPK